MRVGGALKKPQERWRGVGRVKVANALLPRLSVPLCPPLPLPHRSYEPDTLDINADPEELRWWLGILREQIPLLVEKAVASEGGGDLPRRRAAAFGRCGTPPTLQLRRRG